MQEQSNAPQSPPPSGRVELAGFTFGRWTVIEHSHRGAHGAFWRCRCRTCGAEELKRGDSLRKHRRILCGTCDRELIVKLKTAPRSAAERKAEAGSAR